MLAHNRDLPGWTSRQRPMCLSDLLFESGACLVHLARKSDVLMPRSARGEAETLQWVIATLNSIEMVSVPWWFLGLSGNSENGLSAWLDSRLSHVEAILRECEWLVEDRFTAALPNRRILLRTV